MINVIKIVRNVQVLNLQIVLVVQKENILIFQKIFVLKNVQILFMKIKKL